MSELSPEEEAMIVEMMETLNAGDVVILAFAATYSPEEIDQLIQNLHEVHDFLDDIKIIYNRQHEKQAVDEITTKQKQIDNIITLLRHQRDAHVDSIFY